MDSRALVLEALQTLDVDQAALSRRLRRSQATVSRWVSGEAKPDYESCLRLAHLTQTPARRWLEAAGLDPDLVPNQPEPAERSADPEWAKFVSEIETSWRAMDEAARHMAARGARALFRVEPIQRRRRRITDDPGNLGRPKMERVQPAVPRRKYQSQSLATQRLAFGFQSA